MSNLGSSESPRQLTTLTLIVFSFSLVFFFILANGYYNLFVTKGVILAGLIGIVLSFIAWSIGKFIGSSEEGIRGHFPLFILMLMLSAVGVFNALMINLEGKRIFQEAIDSASARYKELPLLAKDAMRDEAIENKIAKVQSLFNSLQQEIRNPRNCGEGPEARRIMKSIQEELPEFTVLSGAGADCGNNEQLVRMYNEQIEEKLMNHPLLVKGNYRELMTIQDKVYKAEQLAQLKLGEMRSEVNNGANVLSSTRPQLEELAAQYQSLALDISKYGKGDIAAKIQPNLEMNSVRNLGEWSQIINLLISRLDKLQTYVYLFIALFADWILIYLFSLLRKHRLSQPKKRFVGQQTINNPW